MTDTIRKRISELLLPEPPTCDCLHCTMEFQLLQKLIETLDGVSIPDAQIEQICKSTGAPRMALDERHAIVVTTLAVHSLVTSILLSELVHPRVLAGLLSDCFEQTVGAGDGPGSDPPQPARNVH
jgi:hypothetical protein